MRENTKQIYDQFKFHIIYLITMKHQNPDRTNNTAHPRRNHDNPRKLSREQQPQNQNTDGHFKKRFIKRDRNGRGRYPQRRDGSDPRRGPKGEKRADDRDLDRELRDYWLTQKGGNKGEEDLKEVAREKLNSQMDDYWKQRAQEAEGKAN